MIASDDELLAFLVCCEGRCLRVRHLGRMKGMSSSKSRVGMGGLFRRPLHNAAYLRRAARRRRGLECLACSRRCAKRTCVTITLRTRPVGCYDTSKIPFAER